MKSEYFSSRESNEIFSKILESFAISKLDKRTLNCAIFFNQYVDIAFRIIALERIPQYLEFMQNNNQEASLEHYLLYYYFAKDYTCEYQYVYNIYNTSPNNKSILRALKIYYKKNSTNPNEKYLANWYLKHLRKLDNIEISLKTPIDQKLFDYIENSKILRNKEETAIKNDIDQQSKSKTHKKRSRKSKFYSKRIPKIEDLLKTLEKVCVGHPFNKIAIVLGLPESEILDIGKSAIPGCSLDYRVSKDDFENLKPHLIKYLKSILHQLTETKSKSDKKKPYKLNKYTDTSKYGDFISIIYTRM